MRINTNINSMRTQEYMRQNQAKMSNAMDRLSSGKRINNASDDAAGLAIATRMRARESGLGVAADNTQNGMSLIRTADSAMNSVSNILLRMRDIANQSANGTNTDKNQIALQKEFGELQKQIDYIAGNTQFNDKNLLDGSSEVINIQTLDSADGSRQIGIKLNDVSAKALGINNLSIGSDKVSVAAFDKVNSAMTDLTNAGTGNHTTKVDTAKKAFDEIKGSLNSADLKKVEDAIVNYNSASGDAAKVSAANDINVAFEGIKGNIKVAKISSDALDQAAVALSDTTNATKVNHSDKYDAAKNAYNSIKSSLTQPQIQAMELAFTAYDNAAEEKDSSNVVTKDLDTAKMEAAQGIKVAFAGIKANITVANGSDDAVADPLAAIKTIDAALKKIADDRATLGATLNRLDFNVNNLKSQQSSMASAASQVEDADMAKEMSEMTKFKILNEAGISMLSQANQTPQMVSKLLQ
ncbi:MULTISPECIES: flagellin [Bacillus cereus group]|uniref:flagellin N-terminal helical domain-containing protein n=1 Tax=Bacillus cereus group TaxID=86661 RepID=UPI000872C525|nr:MULTISPECIES: flagellin [Bacillus cereus group]OFD44408.1 flagellin [Bacillus mycoides]OFD47242.1 flagellin [Bacillus mycoides]WJE26292.1 flagellin [Bacillus cereus]